MRWAAEGHVPPRSYSQPRWNGQRVRGALLVWGDQGIGDQILHAGMIPELAVHADSIVLEVESRLVPLLARSFPTVRVVGLGSELYAGQVDAHAPLGGLGKFLRTTFDAFPRRQQGYLTADSLRVEELRRRLASDQRLVVGLSWISRNSEFGRFRSIRLRDFEPLLKLPGCRFIDLQYGDTKDEREAARRETGIQVERLEDVDNTHDIEGLAALISACDFVITADNTTVHLAGALGKPTWVLVPHGHARIWYWFNGRDDSPWYPRVRVHRQRKGQTWAELIVSIASDFARSTNAS
jgi:ADP-heptose:LPS heptosyltransferase